MWGRAPGWRWLATAASGLFTIAASVAALTWTSIFDAMLATQMALSPSSVAYQRWVAPSVPIFMDIFFFNWTNPEEFPEVKPKLQELGPYRFREIRKHVNVTFHPHNSSVGYRTMRTWYFDSSSNGSLEDVITTLNVIAASAAFTARHEVASKRMQVALSLSLFGEHVQVTKTAGQFLFEGYHNVLMDLARVLPASVTGARAPILKRFGFFYGRNNSIDTDGYVEITSGAAKGVPPGQILKWNHDESLPFYEGKCSQIKGSAGEFLPHGLGPKTSLTMFVPDLCRTVDMSYIDSGELSGIPYHKFAMTEQSFDYSPLSPENSCFCNGDCIWGGVMNVSACRYGSPAFLSMPHFLHADAALRENVEGLNPDPDKHSFYFAVETKLGVPLDVAGRFQFNIYLEPSSLFGMYHNVPKMLFPIFWVQQKVQVTQDVLEEIRWVRALHAWGGVVCACIALAFAALTILAACTYRKSKYTKPTELLGPQKLKDEAEIKLNPKPLD